MDEQECLDQILLCDTLATMIGSGIHIYDAVEVTGKVLPFYQEALDRVRADVKKDGTLYDAMKRTGAFSPVVMGFIYIGEESGNVDVALHEASELLWSYAKAGMDGTKESQEIATYRTFAHALEAGMPILTIMNMLGEIDAFPGKAAWSKVHDDVRDGYGLGEAMERSGAKFGPLAINLTKAGEDIGSVDETFRMLAKHLERKSEYMRRNTGDV